MKMAFSLPALLVCVSPTLFAQPAKAQPTPAEWISKSNSVLTQLEGNLSLGGLREPVEVQRDRWGIAHIYAKNQHDLFFAQGFVAAQDRLFQIDIWRRQANGELAEALGAKYVASDRFARLMKYRGDMDKEWKSYSPDAKEIATAFTQGINACIEQLGDKLPIEFQVLGFRPGKWKPEDVLGRMSGIYMSQNFRNEIERARLVAGVGIDKARWLAPVDPPREYETALKRDDLVAIDRAILADYNAAIKALSFTPAKTQSNNWVVSGSHSASGKPLLASDPHRAIALPSLRYLVHLNAPGWNVIGSGEPALPGVALGHNDQIAWGFTIVGADQADFFIEETNPDRPNEYKVNGVWTKMAVLSEKIAVKGGKEQTVELRYTRHGPVLFHNAARHRAFALKWTGHEPGGAAYLGSLAVDRAKTQSEFLDALKSWKSPGLNFVYADVGGNIGWIAAALTPVRPKHDGLLPAPGDGGFEWDGFLKVGELPQSFNPKEGWIATANHNILPQGYDKVIGFEFAPPFRYDRVRELLTSKPKWELNDFRAMQYDVKSLLGVRLAKLLKDVDMQNKDLEPYKKTLVEWDGMLTAETKAGPLLALWLRELRHEFVAQNVSPELRSAVSALDGPQVMLNALEEPSLRWIGDDAPKARANLLRATFAAAVKKLKAMPPAKSARWGAMHTATFRHPLATLDPAYAKAFDLGPVERPGDGFTPNNANYDDNFNQIHGPTYRHLFDLADWDRGLATSAPGQSGQPGSPHYGDLLPLWNKGEYFPLKFSKPKVDEVTAHRLNLNPK
jgi:penicillin amidase